MKQKKHTTKTLVIMALTIMSTATFHISTLKAGVNQITQTLLNEDFSTGSYDNNNHSLTWSDNGQNWTWSSVSGSSSPNGTETYGANGMSARGMPSLGANGGFEVISDPNPAGKWQVTTSVVIPNSFTSLQSATVSFEYGFRNSVVASDFTLYDSTQGRVIQTTSLSAPSTGVWESADYGLQNLSWVKENDVISLKWGTTSTASATSLEIGGPVKFSITGITSVPAAPAPPITACLAFAGVLILQALKTKKLVA